MKNFLSMCAMHVYVHLAHNTTLDYVPSVVILWMIVFVYSFIVTR
jgi:hypothetical protein